MRSLLIFLSFLILSCATQSHFFKGRYKRFLAPGEKEIFTAYHFMTSEKGDGTAAFRTFYPEKRLLTSYVSFADRNFEIRHGTATYWHENGRKQKEGDYRNDLESGIWNFYNRESDNLSSVGEYEEGQMVGPWKFYDSKGRLKEEFNYIYGLRFGDFMQYDSLGQIVNEGVYENDTIISQTKIYESLPDSVEETMPFMKSCSHIEDSNERKRCSDSTLIHSLYRNMKYPHKAREYGLEGITYTQFVVEKDGSITDIRPLIVLSDLFKYECMRVIKELPPFSPGIQRGEPVRVKYTLPITFKLE